MSFRMRKNEPFTPDEPNINTSKDGIPQNDSIVNRRSLIPLRFRNLR